MKAETLFALCNVLSPEPVTQSPSEKWQLMRKKETPEERMQKAKRGSSLAPCPGASCHSDWHQKKSPFHRESAR